MAFVIYTARDLWPYVTIYGLPVDRNEGWTMFLRVTCLGIAGFVIPLFIPRAFRLPVGYRVA